jgi:hypothetical protein
MRKYTTIPAVVGKNRVASQLARLATLFVVVITDRNEIQLYTKPMLWKGRVIVAR